MQRSNGRFHALAAACRSHMYAISCKQRSCVFSGLNVLVRAMYSINQNLVCGSELQSTKQWRVKLRSSAKSLVSPVFQFELTALFSLLVRKVNKLRW